MNGERQGVSTPRRALARATLLLLVACIGTPARAQGVYVLPRATDTNRDPHVFETNLTAVETGVDLDGHGLAARVYGFNGGSPGPEIRLRQRDRVIVHFRNELAEPLLVHWHGIELGNASDGTPVTQDPVQRGGSYTYRFRATRPGLYWYHSHAMPTNPQFRGLFGPLVVSDAAQTRLVHLGVLPDAAHTLVLMIADTTVCKAPGANDRATFSPDTTLPWVYANAGLGKYPGIVASPTPAELCERPRDAHGLPSLAGPLAAGTIPNVQPALDCGPTVSCRTNEGQLVLTNGRLAAPRGGAPDAPQPLSAEAAAVAVRAGDGVRLQLYNAAVSRYLHLRLTDERGRQVVLFRVGGEGGLLDRVRVEGGVRGGFDTKFERGEILLAPAERADVVFLVPQSTPGAALTLWTEDFRHYGTNEYPYGYAGLPTVPVAHFRVAAPRQAGGTFRIAEGDPLRAHRTVHDPVENLKVLEVRDHLLDPARLAPPRRGSANEAILLTVLGLRESIDGVHGTALHGPAGGFRDIPHLPSSRYARVGDLLELTFRNGTQQHHPVHLHGFSFQPVRLLDLEGRSVFEYEHDEFLDTIDIPDSHSVVVRVRLDDRETPDGRPSGGAAGRWMLHCHIFNHAEIGMMTELVVLER